MARAKRTDRAEARRRYRAEQGLSTESDSDTEHADAIDGAATPAATSGSNRAATQRPARMGIGEAFRRSFTPLDARSDFRALPRLLPHKAFWIPVLLVLGSTAIFVVTRGSDVVTRALLFPYFIQTPALGAVFLSGFLAPRASWLLGALVGLVAALCYSFLITSFSSVFSETPPTAQQTQEAVMAALLLSPIMGAIFAALAAWYRRFLAYSNPNRGRQSQKAKSGGPRPDGKTRTAKTER